MEDIFGHIFEQTNSKSSFSFFTLSKFDLSISMSINKYMASSFCGSSKSVTFRFFSCSFRFSSILKIFAKNKYDFAFLAPCPASGLFVHGAQDTMVPKESVEALAQKLQAQKRITIDYKIIDGANHFFHDKVDQLTTHVDSYLEKRIPEIEAADTTT